MEGLGLWSGGRNELELIFGPVDAAALRRFLGGAGRLSL